MSGFLRPERFTAAGSPDAGMVRSDSPAQSKAEGLAPAPSGTPVPGAATSIDMLMGAINAAARALDSARERLAEQRMTLDALGEAYQVLALELAAARTENDELHLALALALGRGPR